MCLKPGRRHCDSPGRTLAPSPQRALSIFNKRCFSNARRGREGGVFTFHTVQNCKSVEIIAVSACGTKEDSLGHRSHHGRGRGGEEKANNVS